MMVSSCIKDKQYVWFRRLKNKNLSLFSGKSTEIRNAATIKKFNLVSYQLK